MGGLFSSDPTPEEVAAKAAKHKADQARYDAEARKSALEEKQHNDELRALERKADQLLEDQQLHETTRLLDDQLGALVEGTGAGLVPAINVLLVGPQHHGKSTLGSSIVKVWQRRRTWTVVAPSSGSSMETKTLRHTPYYVFGARERGRLVLFDGRHYNGEKDRLAALLKGRREDKKNVLVEDAKNVIHAVIVVCKTNADEDELKTIKEICETLCDPGNNMPNIVVAATHLNSEWSAREVENFRTGIETACKTDNIVYDAVFALSMRLLLR